MYTIQPDSIFQLLISISIVVGSIVAIFTFYKTIVRPIIIYLRSSMVTFGKIESIEREFQPNGGGSLKDAITRIEKMVAKNNAKLRTYLKLDELPMCESDSNGDVIWVNDALCNILSRPETDFLNRNWINIIHPDYKEQLIITWKEVLEQKRRATLRFAFLDIWGNPVFVEGHGEPLFAENGDYLGRFSYFRLLTDIKEK